MDSDIQQADGQIEEKSRPVEPSGSILDRQVAIPFSLTVVLSAIALIAAAALRLPELSRWALSPEEGGTALAARNLVRGAAVPDDMLGQPFVVEWVALFMFLGDTIESVGRVGTAVAGIIAILGVLALRSHFGSLPTAAAALGLAFSPTLISASRSMDGGVLTVALSVLLFAAILRSRRCSGIIYPTLAGIAVALLLLSGPLGLPAAIIVVAGVYLTSEFDDAPDQPQMIGMGAGFIGAFLLFSSALLTQPSSIVEAPVESLSMLWTDHLSNAGDGFQLALWNLLINEPLLLLLAAIGFIWQRESPLIRGLAGWFVVAFAVVSLLGNSGPGGFGLTIVPVGLLAGVGAVELFGRLGATRLRPAWTAAFAGALLVLVFAFISLLGLASPPDGRSISEIVVRFLLIVTVALVPAGVLVAKAGENLAGYRTALVVATALVILSGVTMRSSILSATEWPGEPGNLLSSQAMGANIPVIVDRIHRISRDLTRTERDARMPVGGVGLHVALDEQIEQPFAWYFREYPNLTVIDPEVEPLPEGTQLAILAGSRDPAEVAPGLPGATYIYRYDEPGYIADPDWGGFLSYLFRLEGWRNFFSFVLNRNTSEPVPAEEFHLQAIPLIAERFAVSSGPYGLDDRAGIGSAGGQFNQPRGIAIDDQGGVYVVDGGNSRIQHFDAAGAFDGVIADGALALFPGGTGGAGGLAIDESGNLYVADTWNHQIQVFSPAGEQIRAWGSFYDTMDDPANAAANPGQFYGPRDVAIHDGLLYVTDTGNERVQVFTLEGEFVRMFGQFGSEAGQLIEPVGIDVTVDGVVLVADSHNARISRFSLEGEPLDPWPVDLWTGQQFFEPYVTAGPDGRVYASDSASGQIAVFDASGQPLDPLNAAALLRPYDMAITNDGLQMLVTDGLANAVIRISQPPAE
ncbi:hypothetical protein BH23CHL2_BH23CHL2_08590 [soil metagenome]